MINMGKIRCDAKARVGSKLQGSSPEYEIGKWSAEFPNLEGEKLFMACVMMEYETFLAIMDEK